MAGRGQNDEVPRRPLRDRAVAAVALALLAALVVAGCGDTGDGDPDGAAPTGAPATTATTFAFTVPGGAGGDFDEREVTLGAPPFELSGTLRLPAGASADEPVPAAVVVGDFGPQDEDGTVLGRKPLRDLGEGLAGRGVATVTFPRRTHVYQDQLAADPSVGIEADLLDDAVAGLELLASTEGVDPARLYVVGHGFGGAVSPRIAAKAGEADIPVAGLVLLAAPSRPMPQVLVDEARHLAELDGAVDTDEQNRLALVESQAARIDAPDLDPDVPPGDALGAGGRWWLDQRGYDAATAVGNAQLPVLVLMAGRDYRAGTADVEGWRVATDLSGLVRLEVIDDLDHLLAAGEGPSSSDDYATSDKVDARVFEAVVAFIESPPDT